MNGPIRINRRISRGGWLLLPLVTLGPWLTRPAALRDSLAAGGAQTAISDIRYEVTYDEATAAKGVISVAMSFVTDEAGPIRLSLPAWTPGSYELDNFARHVVSFGAEADGQAIRWDKTDYDTWRVFPTGSGTVTVRFEYRADTLDTGMSWSTPDFAYFNGTNLFLFPEGQGLNFPATVHIRTEPEWRIATGMAAAPDPRAYSAANYHDLVDMPTFVGAFDIDSTRVEGKWYRLATYPTGSLAGERRDELWEQIEDLIPPMAAVFEETPWSTYTIMAVFPEGFQGGSALEHQNSHLGLYTPGIIGSPILALVIAHEMFHAWNVKRLRPVELVPYAYDRAQPTTLLWMSEGITDYYADLALVRGGVVPAEFFFQITGGKISQVSNSPPVALEDASLSTWIEPDDGTAFLYYPKGSLAGLMLDIMIRDATNNRQSLDDVLRELYHSTYKNGTGFSEEQFWDAVSRAAGGKSFDEFEAAFVDGREAYPWDRILPLAALELVVRTEERPMIGVGLQQDESGLRVTAVTPGSAAAAAGIEPGDYLLRVGEIEAGQPMQAFRDRYGDEAPGTPLEVEVRRGAEVLTLNMELRFVENTSYAIEEASDAPEKAVRIREAILEGTVDR
jgi:predicted metalloprotease with PDZ domain